MPISGKPEIGSAAHHHSPPRRAWTPLRCCAAPGTRCTL